jgi:hypothetical protein
MFKYKLSVECKTFFSKNWRRILRIASHKGDTGKQIIVYKKSWQPSATI